MKVAKLIKQLQQIVEARPEAKGFDVTLIVGDEVLHPALYVKEVYEGAHWNINIKAQ